MQSKLVLCFFLLLYSSLFFSQSSLEENEVFDKKLRYTNVIIDSIVNRDYRKVKPLKSLVDLKRILMQTPNGAGWTYYYYRKTKEMHLSNSFDSTVIYADLTLKHFQDQEFKSDFYERFLLKTYWYRGDAADQLGMHEEALLNYQEALKLNDKYPYKYLSYIYSGLAKVHLNMGNDNKALGYYKGILKDSLYMSFSRPAVTTLTRIGVIYDELGKLDSAKTYYRNAIKESHKREYFNNLDALYGNLGVLQMRDNNKDSTVYYFKKAVERATISPRTTRSANEYNEYYKNYILFQAGKEEEANRRSEELFEKLEKLSFINKNDKQLIDLLFDLLKDIYTKDNNVARLVEVFERYKKVNNRFYNQLLTQNLEEIEARYQLDIKESEIIQLEENSSKQKVILKQRSKINWALGILSLLIFGVAYLIIKQRKDKAKYDNAVLEQRLLRSQLNPHFIFNALSTASSLALNKSDLTVEYLSNLGNLFRGILENSREEFISLDEEVETLSHYLKLQSSFSTKFNFEIKSSPQIKDFNEILLPPMIIQPFVENAIEHGFQGNEGEDLKVLFSIEEKSLICTVIDNGLGHRESINLVDEKKHNSLSGKILKERLALYAKKFNAEAYFLINSRRVEEGGGTEVKVVLPLIRDI